MSIKFVEAKLWALFATWNIKCNEKHSRRAHIIRPPIIYFVCIACARVFVVLCTGLLWHYIFFSNRFDYADRITGVYVCIGSLVRSNCN